MLKSLVFAACAALALVPALVQAQPFPSRVVKIIVPQNPGGSSDGMARVLAARLQEKWRQPVIVDFKSGAGGNIGAAAVAQSPADGYTLLLGYLGTQAINGALYKNLTYSPEKDLVPAASLATTTVMVVVNNKVPANTMSELLALARQTTLHYATSGNGSLNHLMGEMINNHAGVKIQHIPYKGIAQALTDTISGQVQVLYIGVPAVLSQVKAGNVKPIAVTSDKRVDVIKDVPTMAESGYKELGFEPWFGLFAPAGTPTAVLQKISTDVNEALRSPEVVEKFTAAGVEPLVMPLARFDALVKADTIKWSRIVRASGATLD